jgi:hypothetical protein
VRRGAWLMGLACFALGCEGQSVLTPEEICAQVESCGGDVENDCNADALELEQDVERFGCWGEYDEYLLCVSSAGCSWYQECEDPRSELDSCVLGFPD